MPKHLFKQYAPDHETIRNHKHLRMFGRLLHNPNLWHMNRRSISGAFAVGLFWAFVPIPFQMIAAAASAILARVNLPVSIALVWITNPVTMPPMFYFSYCVGTWLIGEPRDAGEFELTLQWFTDSMSVIWQPLYLGSLLCGAVAGAVGYVAIRLLWRLHLIRYLKRRRRARARID